MKYDTITSYIVRTVCKFYGFYRKYKYTQTTPIFKINSSGNFKLESYILFGAWNYLKRHFIDR